MNWRDYIVSDPEILLGKPTIKDTRLSVEYLVDRLANGWTEEMLFANHPRLQKVHLQAVFAYIADGLRDGLMFQISPKKQRA
jgi:uncharacterized protein (DUF433 family)